MSDYLDDYFDEKFCDKVLDYLKVSGYHLSISNGRFHLFYSNDDYNVSWTFVNADSFKNWLEPGEW